MDKADLKAENAQIKLTIKELKCRQKELNAEHQRLQKIDQLVAENERLNRENEKIPTLKKEIAITAQQKLKMEQQVKDLRRLTEESKAMKKGMTVLRESVWKPLKPLVNKFKEADKNQSGFICRKQFHDLLKSLSTLSYYTIDSRLFSLLDQHSASTICADDKPGHGHNTGTTDSTQGWSAKTNDRQQWYQIDAVVAVCVSGVITQGRYNADQWIKSFYISHSLDGVTWNRLDKLFNGNTDRDTYSIAKFEVPVKARYIRFHPNAWHSHISMRADLLWVENYDEVDEKKEDESESEFTMEQERKLFSLFDIKSTGKIDVCEFLAILDREAIRSPQQSPNHIIKQTVKYLLYGNVDMTNVYNIDMLAKEAKGYKFEDCSKICCICKQQSMVNYGFNEAKCEHIVCWECLQNSLKQIMDNGELPADCIGCKLQKNGNDDEVVNLDALINGELLRFWVDEAVMDVPFAVRFHKQQDRYVQELQFEKMMETTGMRKCPNCGLVILTNEGCNYFKCKECNTEICYQTGKVAGKGDGKCGGGHSCHY